MPPDVFENEFANEISSGNPNNGINDVHEVSILHIKALREEFLYGMNPLLENYGC